MVESEKPYPTAPTHFKPIATAPIEHGKPFGPVLGWGCENPETDAPDWHRMTWDGYDWLTADKTIFYPEFWHPLPKEPER